MSQESINPRVPYVDIAGQNASIKAELLSAVADVLDHGQFVLGPEVQEFESQFAEMCGTKFAVGVNSGTDALILSLRALGIGPGDEVITVPNSFVASASCIKMVGAEPVFVDVRDDYNIDPNRIQQAITSRTKAVLPVHLTGRPAAMTQILEIARAHDLLVIEDAAQSVMAEENGQRVGSFGVVGCFSCHPLKTLSACGDAGLITTNDEDVYRRLLLLRNIGLESRDACTIWAGNSRLDTLQAAILLVKLRYLKAWTDQRRDNAAFYRSALDNLSEHGLQLPVEYPGQYAVYHTFVVRAKNRNSLRRFLGERGVQTAIHYPIPIHLQPVSMGLGFQEGDFPETEQQASEIVSLPVFSEMTKAQLHYVADAVREFYSK